MGARTTTLSAAGLLLAICGACADVPVSETREEAAAFFANRTLTYVVATAAGGSYDTYGRLIARYLEKHLNVRRVVVKNVPGAGHIRGANEIADAVPDGLTLGTFNTGLILAQLLGRDAVQFDLNRLSWIGKAGGEPRVLVTSSQSGIRTLDDLTHLARPLIVANSGHGNEGHHDALLLADIIGFEITFVSGLSTRAAQLSMMRGEVEAHVASASAYRQFVADGRGRVVVEIGTAPTLHEAAPWTAALGLDAETAGTLAYVSSIARMMRWTAGPAGIPPARLALLREAYAAALADPDLVADARRLELPVLPMDGETLAREIARALQPPPAVAARLKRVLLETPGQ